MKSDQFTVHTEDDYPLSLTVYSPEERQGDTVVLVNSATAVPQKFYRKFAEFLADEGHTVVTYDYRGIGASRTSGLRGFSARCRDWALLDMTAVVDWVHTTYEPERFFMIGHSIGGQVAGLIPNSDKVDAMATLSSQSGYWRLQGGMQKLVVALHMFVTFPVLSALCGYMPMSRIGAGEDIPKGVATEWSTWCRKPGYLLDDSTLPLHRYQEFSAPVLAFSFSDDNWGTKRSVDTMMKAYPNVTRVHVDPKEEGMSGIGHFGYFYPKSKPLWMKTLQWLESAAPGPGK